MNAEALLRQFSEQHVLAFALVLARVAPLFLLAPLFSSKSFPARVRGVTAVALAIGISPVASQPVAWTAWARRTGSLATSFATHSGPMTLTMPI